MLFETEKYKIF